MAEAAENFFEHPNGVSQIKHLILKRYVNAWMPILINNEFSGNLNSGYKTIYYVDGFAGAGVYDDGTPGSPQLVLQAALDHTRLLEGSPVTIQMFFIERNANNCERLRLAVQTVMQNAVGPNVKKVAFEVIHGTFADQMESLITNGRIPRHAPLLVFADPFGFGGDLIPMELMRAIPFWSRRAELFINVMDGFANRFFNVDTRASAINKLMGVENNEWRVRVLNAAPDNDRSPRAAAIRRETFINFYLEQLANFDDGSRQFLFLKFSMRNQQNRHKYHLVFATQHPKGLMEMKKAMVKQTQDHSEFTFSEFRRNRGWVGTEYPAEAVAELIMERFSNGNATGAQIKDYVDYQTIYLATDNIRKLQPALARFMVQKARSFDLTRYAFPEAVDADEEEQ